MPSFIPYQAMGLSTEETKSAAEETNALMQKRRSVRDFSDQPIEKKVLENIIRSAASAPSGAHMEPWTFCLVGSPEVKRKIRIAAEQEEKESYENRMNDEWLEDLAPFGTDWRKPFLEIAPWLIIVFKQSYGTRKNGSRKQHYYVNESVGIACGFLISAIHQAGLVTLTHTPSPMNFLSEVLGRPANEKPYLLLPVGYPASDAQVPDIHRKPLEEVLITYD